MVLIQQKCNSFDFVFFKIIFSLAFWTSGLHAKRWSSSVVGGLQPLGKSCVHLPIHVLVSSCFCIPMVGTNSCRAGVATGTGGASFEGTRLVQLHGASGFAGSMLIWCSAAALLKSLIIFEQGTLHFSFLLGPTCSWCRWQRLYGLKSLNIHCLAFYRKVCWALILLIFCFCICNYLNHLMCIRMTWRACLKCSYLGPYSEILIQPRSLVWPKYLHFKKP